MLPCTTGEAEVDVVGFIVVVVVDVVGFTRVVVLVVVRVVVGDVVVVDCVVDEVVVVRVGVVVTAVDDVVSVVVCVFGFVDGVDVTEIGPQQSINALHSGQILQQTTIWNIFIFFFFSGNRFWYFIQIVS